MIPRRFAPVLFVLILSGIMSAVVSAVATFRVLGAGEQLLAAWAAAWVTAWCIAFPIALVAAPVARRMVDRLTCPTLAGED